MRLLATERDLFEARLHEQFGDKLMPVEKAFEVIADYKDGTFAMGHLGLMLYTNGYNVRGSSTRYPNGLVYHDGRNLFGVGFFSKEGHIAKHAHVVAPRGPERISAVQNFIGDLRAAGLTNTSVYVRHLSAEDRDLFLAAGFDDISVDPWHRAAPEEDETYPNRVYYLEELLEERDGAFTVRNLHDASCRKYRQKNRLAYRRFENFLERNPHLTFRIESYDHSASEQDMAKTIVEGYFGARRELGAVVGSTPEDYHALIRQRPGGTNGRDYFAYLGTVVSADEEVPACYFAGERIGPKRAALYCTITMRFSQKIQHLLKDDTGFTAIPQYVWLEIFKRMWMAGIREVDAGGSEVVGLDDQKRQLGGRAEKTFWVVGRAGSNG